MSANPTNITPAATSLWLRVKQLFPNAIATSGGRSAAHNATIPGSSTTSQHIGGNAFDFVVPGMDPMQVQKVIAESLGMPFGQSISEYGLGMGPRNHLSVGTKGELKKAVNGKYSLLGIVRDWEKDILKQLGLSDGLAETWVDPDKSLTDAATQTANEAVDFNGWFGRIAIAVFALILIAAAVFTFKAGNIASIISKKG